MRKDDELRAAGWTSARECLPLASPKPEFYGPGWRCPPVLMTDDGISVTVREVHVYRTRDDDGREVLRSRWAPKGQPISDHHWWRPVADLFRPRPSGT